MIITVNKNTRRYNWNIKFKQRNYSVQIEKFNNSDELFFQRYDLNNPLHMEIKNSVYRVKTKDLKLQTFDNNPIYGLIDVNDVCSKGEIINL